MDNESFCGPELGQGRRVVLLGPPAISLMNSNILPFLENERASFQD